MELTEVLAQALDELRANARKTGKVTGTSGNKVIVTVDGGSITLPRLASYTTVTVGDVVMIDAMTPGAWLVIGKPLP